MRARYLVALLVLGLVILGAIAQEPTADSSDADASVDPAEAAFAGEGLTADQVAQLKQSEETHTFQAEVNRMMDILINALYSKREVFLRELISNAADACDKYRYLTLRDGNEPGELDIRIEVDKQKRLLTITDTGVGMTREELINNLGTIAQSGTKKFLENLKDQKDLRLIGQFGVGFYSAFVVANTITVTTRRAGEQQYIWQSTAGTSYSVVADPRGNTLEHGTRISLLLKEDALEFAEPHRIRELVARYSEFIDYPIRLWTSRVVEVEDGESDVAAAASDEELMTSDEPVDEETGATEQGEEAEPKSKKTETVWEWELLNKNKPLWTRPKDEITEDEYRAFYRTISKDYEDPVAWDHFHAEGATEFTGLIFAPGAAPTAVFDATKTTSIKLYVRRVLINDVFEDLLPRYLGFIHGVVDADDVAINVSREMLQQDKAIAAIKKKLVRKALELLKSLADREDSEPYRKFWEAFGKNIKLGIIEDGANRNRLAKLLRFFSSKSNGTLTSLEAYVGRMKEGQSSIYYVAGESLEAVERSPFLERLVARGFEVLYLVDPIDEYAVQHMPEFDGHKLVSAMKENLKLDGEDEEAEKEAEKQAAEEFKPLIGFLKTTLAGKVEKVTVSSRLDRSPLVLVTSQYGWSANMERIVRSQALGDSSRASFMAARKTLEINPSHPIIRDLNDKVVAGDPAAEPTARLLYDTALLTSGFSLDDTAAFAARMYELLGAGVTLKPAAAGEPAATAEPTTHDEL